MLRVSLSTGGGQLEEVKAVLLRGSTLVRRHLETSLFNDGQEIRFSVAGAEGGRLTYRGLKWIQAVCLAMHGQAIPRLMKWLAAARLGMRWLQVMSTLTGRRWDKATDLAQFLTGAALYICSSGEWSADTKSADELEFCDVVPAVLGSRSRFTKLRGLLIAGDVLDANEMLATSSRWRHSKGRPVYRCMVLREGMLLLFRECTRPTGFDVLDRSRGAPCVVPAAQTAALRCVNVAPEHDPLTQGASDCVSWSLAVTRLRERGCWMMQLSPCRVLCKALMFVCWH